MQAMQITFNGETHTATQWAKIFNVRPETIRDRHRKGLPINEPANDNKPITYGGVTMTAKEWATALDVSIALIIRRDFCGIPLDISKKELRRTRLRKWREAHTKQKKNLGGNPAGDTICWKCKHAVPSLWKGTGCEWSRKLQPVPGWKAVKTKSYREGYKVIKCPKFEKG